MKGMSVTASAGTASRNSGPGSGDIFDSQSHAHAAAYTQGGQAALRFAFHQLVQESDSDACAGATDRMAKCNGASVHIQAVAVEMEFAVASDHLGGEGFIEF